MTESRDSYFERVTKRDALTKEKENIENMKTIEMLTKQERLANEWKSELERAVGIYEGKVKSLREEVVGLKEENEELKYKVWHYELIS